VRQKEREREREREREKGKGKERRRERKRTRERTRGRTIERTRKRENTREKERGEKRKRENARESDRERERESCVCLWLSIPPPKTATRTWPRSTTFFLAAFNVRTPVVRMDLVRVLRSRRRNLPHNTHADKQTSIQTYINSDQNMH